MVETVSRLTGAKSRQTIVGSTPGVDVSVLKVDSNRVMVASCDPVSFIPSIGPKASARMSVCEVASDVATSGISPRFAMVDLNLPPQVSDPLLVAYWTAFHQTCLDLGLSIVGGHTGRFQGCDYSVIGGATLWAFCGDNQYVTAAMAEDGDDLILTKSAGYGATAVLTRAFPQTVKKAVGRTMFDKACQYFDKSNTVKDAIVAARCGLHERGVTGMHDATEGGVIAALFEMAGAAGLGGTILLDDIPVSSETRQICKFFRIDPLVSLGEGSLVIACKPGRTGSIVAKLRSNAIDASVVGQLSSKLRRVYGVTKQKRSALRYPTRDRYWQAYWKGVEMGWS